MAYRYRRPELRNGMDELLDLMSGAGPLASGDNSSDTPLAQGGVFTGNWEDVSGYGSVTIAVQTDANGSYALQFSSDGVNIESTLTRYYRTDLINAPHRFTVTRKYMRIVYTDAGDSPGQSFFRLQILYGDRQPLNVPLGGTVSLDYDSTVTRSADYLHDVSRGLWQGRANWVKFGYNPDIDNGATEVIWANGAAFGPATIPLTPTTFTFVSDSILDDVGQTGATALVVYYADSNGKPAVGVVTMDGTTPVVSSFEGYGINRVAVLSNGGLYTNAGNITVTNTTGGSQAAYVPAGGSVTQQVIFHVGNGYDALINELFVNVLKTSGGAAPRVTVFGYAYNRFSQTKYELFRIQIDTSVENTFVVEKTQPLVLTSQDVFWMEATTNQNDTAINARIGLTHVRRLTT